MQSIRRIVAQTCSGRILPSQVGNVIIWPYHAQSARVAACRGFLGEGIIPPVLSTSTAIISFIFASRFWGALLASFQWSAWPSAADRQVAGSHLVVDPRGTAGAQARRRELARRWIWHPFPRDGAHQAAAAGPGEPHYPPHRRGRPRGPPHAPAKHRPAWLEPLPPPRWRP